MSTLSEYCQSIIIAKYRVDIKSGIDINQVNEGGRTPLTWAIANNYMELVEFLLTNQADVNQADAYNNTPLIMAVKNGNQKIIKRLLSNNANVDKDNSYGVTPLMWAILANHSTTAQILLDSGANVFRCNTLGNTPLMLATRAGRTSRMIGPIIRNHIYNILLDTGLNVLPRDILREIINYL